MDIEKFSNLCNEFLITLKNRDKAKADLQNFIDNNPEPEQPQIVMNLTEWEEYELAHKEWVTNKEAKSNLLLLENSSYENIEKALMSTMPSKVWFKHDTVMIGKAYSNWGGSHYFILVQPVGAELKNLDQTYHGD